MTPAEPLLRVVPDPNILVSATVSVLGMPAAIVLAWGTGAFELIVSDHLLDELRDVLMRPKFRRYRTEEEVTAYVESFRVATIIADPPTRRIVPPDERDDYLMLLGQAAGADCILSGDRHLTTLTNPNPPVFTPRDFYALLVGRGQAPVRQWPS